MPIKSIISPLSIVALLLLSGCGGGGSSSETSEASGLPAVPTATADGADLRVVSVHAPTAMTAGSDTTFAVEVENIGGRPAADAMGSTGVELFLSEDNVIDPREDLFIGYVNIKPASSGGLQPDESVAAEATVKLPAGMSTGTYYVGAYADSRGVFPEIIEHQWLTQEILIDDVDRSNNGMAMSAPVSIQGSQACVPDDYEDDEQGRVVGLGTETHNFCQDSLDVYLVEVSPGQQVNVQIMEIDAEGTVHVSVWDEDGNLEQVETTDASGLATVELVTSTPQVYRLDVAARAVRDGTLSVSPTSSSFGSGSDYHITVQ